MQPNPNWLVSIYNLSISETENPNEFQFEKIILLYKIMISPLNDVVWCLINALFNHVI
jgi:hypothetical protein